MKKIYLFLIIAAIIGLLAGAYGWFFVYNKPHTDYSTATPFAKISADECYNGFVISSEPSKLWLGQVIEIHGKATIFEQTDSLSILVFVFNEDEMFGNEGIRCSFLPNDAEQAARLNLPAEVTLKGYCTGYNGSDVLLEQCVFTN